MFFCVCWLFSKLFFCRSWSGSKLIASVISSRWTYHTPQKIYVDEGSGQILRASSWEFCIIAYASSKCPDEPTHSQSIITAFSAWTEKRKQCRWRFRPNFVPSKAVVLLLLIHSLIFLPLVCRGLVFGPRFAIHYLVFFLVFAIISARKREHDALLYCLSTISVLWLFLTVPWIGLKYVIVILRDHQWVSSEFDTYH